MEPLTRMRIICDSISMNWDAELAYFVTPKSGPMRAMRTLHDVKYALLDDLTAHYRHRRYWFLVRAIAPHRCREQNPAEHYVPDRRAPHGIGDRRVDGAAAADV